MLSVFAWHNNVDTRINLGIDFLASGVRPCFLNRRRLFFQTFSYEGCRDVDDDDIFIENIDSPLDLNQIAPLDKEDAELMTQGSGGSWSSGFNINQDFD